MDETQKAQYIAQRNLKPYNGNLPYIFISYSHLDWRKAMLIVERLMHDGYRVWFDEGIDPGTEWGENIAGHVEHCEVFIALISQNYLNSGNCLNELDYSRKKDRQRLLVYLEKVELSGALDMQHSRFQAVHKYTYQKEEDFYAKLYEGTILEKCRDRSTGIIPAEDVQNLKFSSHHGKFPVKPIAIAAIVVAGVIAAMILLTGRSGSGDSGAGDSVAEENMDNSGDGEGTMEEEQLAEDDDSGEAVEEVEEAGEVVVEAGTEDEETEEEAEAAGVTEVAEEEADTTSDIPDGAIEYNGHYYKIYTTEDVITWDDAQEQCEALGGHLATFTSEDEWEFVVNGVLDEAYNYWIGGYYDFDGFWKWVTGEDMSYQEWDTPNQDRSVTYPYMGVKDLGWLPFDEDACYVGSAYFYVKGYLCEWDANAETDSLYDEETETAYTIPEDAEEYDGHYYYAYSVGRTLSWDEAQEQCEQRGGHLAVVTSEEEQRFLEIKIMDSSSLYWLGGFYDIDGEWKWITGEDMTYEEWTTPSDDESVKYPYIGIRNYGWLGFTEEGLHVGSAYFYVTNYICEWEP